jgi:hypothetical protein
MARLSPFVTQSCDTRLSDGRRLFELLNSHKLGLLTRRRLSRVCSEKFSNGVRENIFILFNANAVELYSLYSPKLVT